jgi:NTE family protein
VYLHGGNVGGPGHLNQLPTTFVLPLEAVDRLRAAAGTIIAAWPQFQRKLRDAGVKVVGDPTGTP